MSHEVGRGGREDSRLGPTLGWMFREQATGAECVPERPSDEPWLDRGAGKGRGNLRDEMGNDRRSRREGDQARRWPREAGAGESSLCLVCLSPALPSSYKSRAPSLFLT